MNRRLGGTLGGALIGFCALIPAFAIAWPARSRLDDVRGATASVPEADNGALDALEAEFAALQRADVPAVRATARLVMERIPTEGRRLDRLLAVSEAADQHGVLMRSAKDLPPRDGDDRGYRLFGLELAATGSFDALVAFVEALETGPRLAVVESLEFRRDEGDAPRVAAILTVRFPIRTGAPNPAATTAHALFVETPR